MQNGMLTPAGLSAPTVREVAAACSHTVTAPTPKRQVSYTVRPNLINSWSFRTGPAPNTPSLYSLFDFMILLLTLSLLKIIWFSLFG